MPTLRDFLRFNLLCCDIFGCDENYDLTEVFGSLFSENGSFNAVCRLYKKFCEAL